MQKYECALFCVFHLNSVNLMKTKLDPEGLGIILLGPFLQEFFPEQVIPYFCVPVMEYL